VTWYVIFNAVLLQGVRDTEAYRVRNSLICYITYGYRLKKTNNKKISE